MSAPQLKKILDRKMAKQKVEKQEEVAQSPEARRKVRRIASQHMDVSRSPTLWVCHSVTSCQHLMHLYVQEMEEFVTGFHKRKLERKRLARMHAKEREKSLRRAERLKRLEARKLVCPWTEFAIVIADVP